MSEESQVLVIFHIQMMNHSRLQAHSHVISTMAFRSLMHV